MNIPDRLRFHIWLAFTLLIGVLFALQLWRGLPVQTDMMAMLPAGEADPVVNAANKQLQDKLGEQSLILVGAPEAATAIRAADAAVQSLAHSHAFRGIDYSHKQQGNAGFQFAMQARFALADPQWLDQLATDLPAALDETAAQLYGPLGAPRAALLARDPLFLAGSLIASRFEPGLDFDPASGVALEHGEGKVWALIRARNGSMAFSDGGPQRIRAALDNARTAAATQGGELIATSVALHSAKASDNAKGEIDRIGIGSWVGSLLLMWLAFRRLSAILVCLIPLVVATMAAIVATSAIMGSLHVITLVFGASLIGVAIDYGTFCFADSLHAPPGWNLSAAVHRLRPALFYGLCTSVAGYLSLAVAPFPGLREIAVFSAAGLIGAWLTVTCAFPLLLPRYQPATQGMRVVRWQENLHKALPRGRWLWLVAVVIIFTGLARLTSSDDLRTFYTPDAELAQTDARIKALFARTPENQFYLVSGRDADEVLARQAALRNRLNELQQRGAISGYRALSLPDTATQQARITRLQAALAQPAYAAWLTELGLNQAAIAADHAAIAAAKPVALDTWLASPLGEAERMLWLAHTAHGPAAIVLLSGIRQPSQLAQVALPGVQYVDRVGDLSRLMARYRNIALGLTGASLLAMLLLLTPRHGLLGAAATLCPALLACLTATALFGLLGVPLNIFSAFALLLILALGTDYAILYRESGWQNPAAALGVLLDSSTTLLSFGLLALSSLPAARSFGLMLLLGITLAFLFAPMAQRKPEKSA